MEGKNKSGIEGDVERFTHFVFGATAPIGSEPSK